MATHIYNVKQAAKILGLSTNTTYKYLNEGRIRAARGHVRGTFIITHKALETFLGTKLPEDPLKELDPNNTIPGLENAEDAYVEIAPPSLSIQVSRLILALALISLILNQLFFTKIPTLHTINLLITYLLFLILLYQYGGFTKRQ
ncbi:hypothetical protein A2572_03815 [Candidatus Collierbacteria bacterium RIFOXYD1_FULL_40_9]|uniref:Helix-turn-helix domain-containing protein n=1 Tax=Candidatus Collierbacteria bacterium RIFOXYD1_FULL_40_9 TaxID=1817731 RepID=A0A1F5FU52_9BACT|nr:MAG: hypothetical protein A2572_03815 [Candidatus Collierbacteria bacterium RIFOXYD1_FULL_40_9]